MKLWKKILLIVLAVVVIAVAAGVIWQWKNVKALHAAVTGDSETLAQAMQTTTEEHQKQMESSGVVVSAPSQEQNEALINGTVSADEVKESLNLSAAAPEADESGEEVTAQTLLNQCVAELYAYQIDLEEQLGQMKQAAIDQWNALPSEQRTNAKKQEIGMNGIHQCYTMEAETDAAVKELLADYRTRLEQIGGDTSQLDQLWTYYCEEKDALKAFYLNKYLN
jgi:uncharacterized protein YxeA